MHLLPKRLCENVFVAPGFLARLGYGANTGALPISMRYYEAPFGSSRPG